MERVEITTGQLLEALRAATKRPDNPDGALTVNELSEATGITRERLRRLIGAAMQAGTVELAGHKSITRIDGRAAQTPAYRVVMPKAA